MNKTTKQQKKIIKETDKLKTKILIKNDNIKATKITIGFNHYIFGKFFAIIIW